MNTALVTPTFDPCRRHHLIKSGAMALTLSLPWSVRSQAISGPAPGIDGEVQPWFGADHPRADVEQFIEKMLFAHGLNPDEMVRALKQAVPQATAIKLIKPAAPGAKSWRRYRARNVDSVRIKEGVAFWTQHRRLLDRMTEQFGVPSAIVVAILGIETVYGRHTGNFRALDTLATLGFDYPPRSDFFLSELEQLFLLAHENRRDVTEFTGSYAGALGMPQFMPGSWRRYAVDFSGNGRTDLHSDVGDIVGSVAHFLVEHGWRRDEPTHALASLDEQAKINQLLAEGIKPERSLAALQDLGVRPKSPVPNHDGPAALIDLPDWDGPTVWWLGFQNFYTITRYNRSNFYAGVVIELAQALSDALTSKAPPVSPGKRRSKGSDHRDHKR